MSPPLLAFRFRLEIDGLTQARFSECSGLLVETEVEELREGGVNDFVYKLPKGSKHVNLSLKHGLTDSAELWDWHQQIVQGTNLARKPVFVILLSVDGQTEQWRWSLKDALPVKWVGPELKADGSAVAIESLEIAHHGLAKV